MALLALFLLSAPGAVRARSAGEPAGDFVTASAGPWVWETLNIVGKVSYARRLTPRVFAEAIAGARRQLSCPANRSSCRGVLAQLGVAAFLEMGGREASWRPYVGAGVSGLGSWRGRGIAGTAHAGVRQELSDVLGFRVEAGTIFGPVFVTGLDLSVGVSFRL